MKRLLAVAIGLTITGSLQPASGDIVVRQCHYEDVGSEGVDENGTPTYTTTSHLVCDDQTIGSNSGGRNNDPGPMGGGGGGHDPGPPCDGSCQCKRQAASRSNQCQQDALSLQTQCVQQNTQVAQQYCTQKIPPIGPSDIGVLDRIKYTEDVCVHENTHGATIRDSWTQCAHDIAVAKTADLRGQCLEDLESGTGDWFNKWKIDGSFSIPGIGGIGGGAEGGSPPTQGIIDACRDEAYHRSNTCRDQQDCENAACDGRSLPGCH